MQALKQAGVKMALRFALMSVCMGIFPLMFLPPMRRAFLRLFGSRIGSGAVLQNVRFYNLYRTGLRGLHIGRRCYIGNEVLIDLADKVIMEDDVTLAARVHILTHVNVGYDAHPLQSHIPRAQAPVHIERGAFIGANAVLSAGVRIGECSVVGAGAVVVRDIPAYTVVAGVPARTLRSLKKAP